jgi:hypothetical protein
MICKRGVGEAPTETPSYFITPIGMLYVVAKGQLLTKIIADIIVAVIATTILRRVTLPPQPASYPPKNL